MERAETLNLAEVQLCASCAVWMLRLHCTSIKCLFERLRASETPSLLSEKGGGPVTCQSRPLYAVKDQVYQGVKVRQSLVFSLKLSVFILQITLLFLCTIKYH